MRTTENIIQQYTLPLDRPLTTDVSTTIRQGLVLTLHSETGLQGFGEIAPLPGLHKENLSEATEQLLKYRSHLIGISVTRDMLSFDRPLSRGLPADLYPSVRSGIEMAILDLLLQANPVPGNLPRAIPVNALLTADNKSITEQVEELLLQGFSCIKIKIARQPLEEDIKEVAAILSQIRGKASLRLDVNRRWTLQQAKQFCEAIDPKDIEYIEEPTQTPADHAHLAGFSPVPIALDETLTGTPCEQLDERCYRAVVLKPSVLGGFSKTAQIARWARQYNITPVISSAFQTSLAIRMYLLFAVLNEITEIPLGLDTGKWFREDLLSTPFVLEAGKIGLAPLTVRPKLRQDFLKPIEAKC